MKNRSLRGFTLLEMSLVIVIIGLIVGSILVGKAMITNARLQNVSTDAAAYMSAIANFKQAYQALPGDFSGATTVWGASATNNGNSDGKIASDSGSNPEAFLFWQHLSLASMLTAPVTGAHGPAGAADAVPETNVPAGSIKGSGFSAIWLGTVAAADAHYIAGDYGNVLWFGGINPGAPTNAPILSPEQAAAIDGKFDDGMPGTGKLRAPAYSPADTVANSFGSCASTVDPATANYVTSNSATLCPLLFLTGF